MKIVVKNERHAHTYTFTHHIHNSRSDRKSNGIVTKEPNRIVVTESHIYVKRTSVNN